MSSTPDNLLTRITAFYLADESFKNESGELVKYKQPVMEFYVKDKLIKANVKLKNEHKLLLEVADDAE